MCNTIAIPEDFVPDCVVFSIVILRKGYYGVVTYVCNKRVCVVGCAKNKISLYVVVLRNYCTCIVCGSVTNSTEAERYLSLILKKILVFPAPSIAAASS